MLNVSDLCEIRVERVDLRLVTVPNGVISLYGGYMSIV